MLWSFVHTYSQLTESCLWTLLCLNTSKSGFPTTGVCGYDKSHHGLLGDMDNAPVELVFGLDGELTEVDEQPAEKQPEAKLEQPSVNTIADSAQAKKQPVIAVDLTQDEQRSSLPESIAAWLESVGLDRLVDVFKIPFSN